MLWQKQLEKPILPDLELTSDRLLMRPARIDDWQHWVEVRGKNIEHLQPFEPRWGKNWDQADFFERRLERQAREWRIGQARSFLIFENNTRSLIGGMNINNICRGAAQHCTLGYWISKTHEGQGLMKEAVRLTLEYCFGDLKLHRVNCSCLLHNERSKHLLLSLGFEEEGMAKKYLQINGAWQDHLLFGLPRETWESL